MTGMSRVVYAAARDRAFPRFLEHIDKKTGAPNRALAMLFALAMVTLSIFYFLNVNLETALLIPSGAAISIYVVGSGSGIRLLKEKGAKGALPWISLVASFIILPFVGVLLSVTAVVVVLALFYAVYTSHH